MKKDVLLSCVLIIIALVGCSGSLVGISTTKCDQKVVDEVKAISYFSDLDDSDDDYVSLERISIAELAYGYRFGRLDNVKWEIASRGNTGCVVTLTAAHNGVGVTGPAFHVSLEDRRVHPDNNFARAMIEPLMMMDSYPEGGYLLSDE
jgi:hypothetical protein